MLKTLISTLSIAATLSLQAQLQVSYFIQAHQDDWQLFMSSKVVSDLNAGGKVVFITLTAGDAGNGTGSYGSTVPFFTARENGSMYSTKYAADLDGGVPLANASATIANVNGHNMVKYVYKNTVNYFLRLPDGGGTGDGNPITGYKSLKKLKAGTISNISSVDATTTYNGWADLTNTIKTIVTTERGTDNQVWINTPSLNTANNPDDHSDHIHSGIAGQDAVNSLLWVGINEFVDYYSAGQPANLNISDHENAAAIFGECVWGLMESKYAAPFDDGHKGWLPMDYFAVKRAPSGNATNAANLITSAENKSTNQIFSTEELKLIELPMIVSISNVVKPNTELKFILSPFEKGNLHTVVTNTKLGTSVEINNLIENKNPLVITIEKVLSDPGIYTVKNILNNKYVEYKTITVQ